MLLASVLEKVWIWSSCLCKMGIHEVGEAAEPVGGGDVWEAQLCVGDSAGLGGLPQKRQLAFAYRCGF